MRIQLLLPLLMFCCVSAFMGHAAAESPVASGAVSKQAVGDEVDPLEQAAAAVEQDFKKREDFEFEYYKWRVEFSKASWEWNQWTGKVIFCLVIGIVIFSMFISAAQFRSDLWLRRYKAQVDKSDEGGAPIKFEISPEKIAVQSQTIGVIILAASLAFFFLYLEHIYPMHVVKDEDSKFSVGEHTKTGKQ